MSVIDLFCGAGGWAGGLEILGHDPQRTLGIEWDEDAAATHSAAGFPTLEADIAALEPGDVLDDLGWGRLEGLIASPPCQAFSNAGKGEGRKASERLLDHIGSCMSGWKEPPEDICSEDVRADLTLQPLRWAWELSPDWIACEQVPGVLPMWQGMEVILRQWGYRTWSGKLSSETFGVAQTRERAILLARKRELGPVEPPHPTHTAYNWRLPDNGRYEGVDNLLDPLEPWVSMAEALGWGMPDRPSFTVPVGSANGSSGVEWGGSTVREELHERLESADPDRWVPEDTVLDPGHGDNRRTYGLEEPAPTIAFGNDAVNWRWKLRTGNNTMRHQREEADAKYERSVGDPAPTLDSKVGSAWKVVPPWVEARNDQTNESPADVDWPLDRPATTVAGRGLVPDPGATSNRHNDSGKSRNDGIRVSVEQAACLQSFRIGWPWQGSKTSQYRQVGNAVPPLMAASILRQVIS